LLGFESGLREHLKDRVPAHPAEQSSGNARPAEDVSITLRDKPLRNAIRPALRE
jgi:hypothetical protein